MQGGLVSPATKAEPESRAGTWLDDAPLLITFCVSVWPGRWRGTLSARPSFVFGDGAHVSGTAQEASHQSRVQKSCRRLPLGPVLRFSCGLLPTLRRHVDIWGLVRRGQAEATDVRACSVQVVVLFIRKIIGRLSKHERQELARAFLQNDASNPTYRGFKYMLQAVEQLNVAPALVSYVNTELAGQLRGMSQEAIFNSWVEAQIGGVMGQLRERSREEAERKRDLWQ